MTKLEIEYGKYIRLSLSDKNNETLTFILKENIGKNLIEILTILEDIVRDERNVFNILKYEDDFNEYQRKEDEEQRDLNVIEKYINNYQRETSIQTTINNKTNKKDFQSGNIVPIGHNHK